MTVAQQLESSLLSEVILYADGACKGNPGPGGWGVWLQAGGHQKNLYGGELNTTNNRMELRAVIEGLNSLKKRCHVKCYVDSQYVKNGVLEWMSNWKCNGWRTANKKPVKNIDLWQQLDRACLNHDIDWFWVKGHSGDEGNEKADQLANLGVEQVLNQMKVK